MTSSDYGDEDSAQRYDAACADMFAPEILGPAVDVLAEYAGAGRALEFAIGTGRVGIPLRERGFDVVGIELSEPMVAARHRKAPDFHVAVGDMATTRVDGEFSLVYLVFNTIANLRTQAEQVECFRNAARNLSPGGRFVIELWVPGIRRFPPGAAAVPFDVTCEHAGLDTYDMSTQQGTSHHYTRQEDDTYRRGESNFRYIWPAECDPMAQLAGLVLEMRAADWVGTPLTGDSPSHVPVWRKPMA